MTNRRTTTPSFQSYMSVSHWLPLVALHADLATSEGTTSEYDLMLVYSGLVLVLLVEYGFTNSKVMGLIPR